MSDFCSLGVSELGALSSVEVLLLQLKRISEAMQSRVKRFISKKFYESYNLKTVNAILTNLVKLKLTVAGKD